MPAVLTGIRAEEARAAARRMAPAPDDDLPAAVTALLEQLRRQQQDTAALIGRTLSDQNRAGADSLAAMMAAHEAAIMRLAAAVERRGPETIEMTVTERDGEGRIKAVRFTVV